MVTIDILDSPTYFLSVCYALHESVNTFSGSLSLTFLMRQLFDKSNAVKLNYTIINYDKKTTTISMSLQNGKE
jgi:hypothetical protein